jgi:hypothetical protein
MLIVSSCDGNATVGIMPRPPLLFATFRRKAAVNR